MPTGQPWWGLKKVNRLEEVGKLLVVFSSGLALLVLAAIMLWSPKDAHASASCTTNRAPSGVYTLTLCLANPPNNALLTNAATVSASVTVPGTTPSAPHVVFYLATPPLRQYIFNDGFESGSFSAWTTHSSGFIVQSSTVNSGVYAAQGNTSNGNTYAEKNLPSTYTDGYSRIYFYLASNTTNVALLKYRISSGSLIGGLYVSSAGKLGLRSDAGNVTLTSATTVTTGLWHSLELHATINGASGSSEVWLDGVRVNDLSVTINLGTNAIGRLMVGELQTARTYNVYFDDTVFDTQRVGP